MLAASPSLSMEQMMTENLKEPSPIDWENHNPQSRYTPPPPAKDASGAYIPYSAKLPANMRDPKRLGVTDEGLRSFELGPLTIDIGGGKKAEIRFYTVNVRKFKNSKTGEEMNVSSASKALRSAGFAGKPNSNRDYDAAFASIGGKNLTVTIEWRAKNRDTGEEIDGYDNFPDDPQRPGFKNPVVRRGETLPDGRVVESEILFANARVRYVS